MNRRVAVDPDRESVPLRASVLEQLRVHAVECVPEECCGLVVGNDLERYLRSVRCNNDMTARHRENRNAYPRDGQSAFYMDPSDVSRVSREADEAGLTVSAIYHSHVGEDAYLSDVDLAYAEQPYPLFPTADWIVLPVLGGAAKDPGIFRRRDGRFVGHPARSVAG